MGAIGSVLARGLASLGGPLTAGFIVVAGIVLGGVGGAAITLLPSGAGVPAGSLAVYPCPRQGPAIATLQGGQQLLVTGRLADGSWLRIHLPDPGRTEGWVEAGPLTVSGSVDTLPVATCGAEAGAPTPAVAPAESLTAIIDATPSPAITPSPTPSPQATPSPTANVGPTLTSLASSQRTISYDQGAYCPTAAKSTTISVKAADVSGVASVTLFWREPGAGSYAQTPMAMASGAAANGTWQTTLDTTANGITAAGTLAYYVVAADSAGTTSRSPTSGAKTVTVKVCANTGPTISSVSSSSGSTLYWNPLGVVGAACQTATNVTAAVSDQDQVSSVTLYFRRPGSSTWSSKPMDNTTLPPKWYANLDTLGDQITIPSPPTGSLSWYIKAVDGKNKASQSKTFSTVIRRCDSPASFDGVQPTSLHYSCTSATIQLQTYANDRDQPENGLKVVFYWTLSNPRTKPTPISGHMTANSSSGNSYYGTTASFNGKTFYYGVLTAYVVTTDKYGGTTTSPVYTTTGMSCQ